jgi:hypothetical protein
MEGFFFGFPGSSASIWFAYELWGDAVSDFASVFQHLCADSVLASFFPFSKKEWIFDQVLAEISISFEVFVF